MHSKCTNFEVVNWPLVDSKYFFKWAEKPFLFEVEVLHLNEDYGLFPCCFWSQIVFKKRIDALIHFVWFDRVPLRKRPDCLIFQIQHIIGRGLMTYRVNLFLKCLMASFDRVRWVAFLLVFEVLPLNGALGLCLFSRSWEEVWEKANSPIRWIFWKGSMVYRVDLKEDFLKWCDGLSSGLSRRSFEVF